MVDTKLSTFVEEQINVAARMITERGDKSDKVAGGKLLFFIALRSALKGDIDESELGLIHAVNDTLHFLKLTEKTFYK